jgi:hypothetical protein
MVVVQGHVTVRYAFEKFPELEDVDESRLVEEIRKLDDKLKARKRK